MNYAKEAACAGASTLRNVPTDIPRGEIYNTIEEIKSNINRYDILVNRLAIRLSPALSSAPPECSDNAKCPAATTDMGNYLEDMRLQLRDINNNLESILERIEL